MGALPRPATPGPWEDFGADICDDCGRSVVQARYSKAEDAAAIAALPERIAREDRVRGACGDAIDAFRLGQDRDEGVSDFARHVLRILDGEVAW